MVTAESHGRALTGDRWRVRLTDGREVSVKAREGAPDDEYEAEAAALAWLAEPGTVRVPAVIARSKRFLALEWVEPGALDVAGEEELGRGLAELGVQAHRTSASRPRQAASTRSSTSSKPSGPP